MKRKFSIFLNVAVLALCVCAIAIGVYSAKTASLNVTGSIGFTAHNCDVDISGYIYGHSTTVDGEPIAEPANDSEKKYLTYGASNTKATETAPLKISGTAGELKFGDVYFSDMGESGEVEPITIELTITNKSKFAVLLDDNTTVAEEAGYTAVCTNPLHVLYIDSDEEKTTTLQYILRPAKDSNGNYVNIDSPVSVTLGMNFSKIDTDIVGNTADGWVNDGNILTAVPTIENYGSDTLIIPAMVDGTAITQIGDGDRPNNINKYNKIIILKGVNVVSWNSLCGCKMVSITIPNSVTSIGDAAFEDCSNLTSIAIPSSVTSIGNIAFSGCSSLTSITIPSSVTSISSDAFRYCSSIVSITVDSGNTTYDSRDNCNAIIETSSNTLILGCPNTTIPSSVTSIGGDAFSGQSSLTGITIPSNVTSIGNGAFSNCISLISITVDSGNTTYDSRDNCNAIIETSTNTLIAGCVKTVIPSSVTSIGSSAFYYCSSLTSITIPSSVTSIGTYAFYNCTNLTSVTFADTTKTWTVKSGSTVKNSSVNVSTPATNATNLTGQYGGYTWKKNS